MTLKKKGMNMEEYIRRYIGKICIIYLTKEQINGVIREVNDGAMIIEMNGAMQVINLMHVIRLFEYPYNQKG